MNDQPNYEVEIKELEETIDRLKTWIESQGRRANKKRLHQKEAQLKQAISRYQELLDKAMGELHFNSTQS